MGRGSSSVGEHDDFSGAVALCDSASAMAGMCSFERRTLNIFNGRMEWRVVGLGKESRWTPRLRVRRDVGLLMHVPSTNPDFGSTNIYEAQRHLYSSRYEFASSGSATRRLPK